MKIRLVTSAVAAAGALVLAATPMATAGVPAQAAAAQQAAPQFKAEFPVTAKGAAITFRGKDLTADLTGKATLSADPPTVGNLKGKASGTLTVSADHPDLGKVTVESKATGTASFKSVANPFPAQLDLSSTATVTIQNPGGTAQRGMNAEPLVLTTKNPATLTGTLTQFPPKGDFTRLNNPVDFVDTNDVTIATIDKFPVVVGSLN